MQTVSLQSTPLRVNKALHFGQLSQSAQTNAFNIALSDFRDAIAIVGDAETVNPLQIRDFIFALHCANTPQQRRELRNFVRREHDFPMNSAVKQIAQFELQPPGTTAKPVAIIPTKRRHHQKLGAEQIEPLLTRLRSAIFHRHTASTQRDWVKHILDTAMQELGQPSMILRVSHFIGELMRNEQENYKFDGIARESASEGIFQHLRHYAQGSDLEGLQTTFLQMNESPFLFPDTLANQFIDRIHSIKTCANQHLDTVALSSDV